MELLRYFNCDFNVIKYCFDSHCESIQDENINSINTDDNEIIPPTTIYMIR